MAVTSPPRFAQGVICLPPASEAELEATVVEDVLGRDASATLGFLAEEHAREEHAAAEKMRAVTHFADLHRVGDGSVGAVDEELMEVLADRHGRWAFEDAAGLETELRLAGEGAFAVTEFAVTEIAAVLGMSEPAARAYVGQALELRDRLPRLWGQVMAGVLPSWKGRKVAEQTIPLNPAAAAYVDAQLAPFAHRVSLGRVRRAVDAAVLRHDPRLAAERAAAAAEGRGVWVIDELDGTSRIEAVVGTPDASAFDAALDQVATTLGALGDSDPQQVRRARAVGVLADPQHALDLVTSRDPGTADVSAAARRPQCTSVGGPSLHVHLHTDAVAGVVPESGTGHLARVARFGPRALAAVEQWIRDLAPGASIKVTPVIDCTESISVDAYEVPDRLRRQVEERDDCCRFPWCGRQGIFDVDHIEAYEFEDPDDPGGPAPPDQTHSENLSRLCRFHHRVKTHGRWSYRRLRGDLLLWTSPHGRTYRVDNTGTTRLD